MNRMQQTTPEIIEQEIDRLREEHVDTCHAITDHLLRLWELDAAIRVFTAAGDEETIALVTVRLGVDQHMNLLNSQRLDYEQRIGNLAGALADYYDPAEFQEFWEPTELEPVEQISHPPALRLVQSNN